MAFEAFGQVVDPSILKSGNGLMNEWILFGILQILTQHFLREKVPSILGSSMWCIGIFLLLYFTTYYIVFVEKQILLAVFTDLLAFLDQNLIIRKLMFWYQHFFWKGLLSSIGSTKYTIFDI